MDNNWFLLLAGSAGIATFMLMKMRRTPGLTKVGFLNDSEKFKRINKIFHKSIYTDLNNIYEVKHLDVESGVTIAGPANMAFTLENPTGKGPRVHDGPLGEVVIRTNIPASIMNGTEAQILRDLEKYVETSVWNMNQTLQLNNIEPSDKERTFKSPGFEGRYFSMCYHNLGTPLENIEMRVYCNVEA